VPKKIVITESVPKNAPKIFIIQPVVVNYSQPKLFIPKDKNGNATVARPWHVWFNFKNPETGKFDNSSKFKFKHGINKYKTVQQRKEVGMRLVRVYTQLLDEGFNPYTKESTDGFHLMQKQISCKKALKMAYDQKAADLAPSTQRDWEYRLNKFLEYAEAAGFADFNINDVGTFHIASFLNYMAESGQGPKSINNFRACLSGLWGKLANDTVAIGNPVTVLKKRKENPQKNKPFTPEEISEIKKYLLANDPGLLTFIRFVAFAFLRPVEVVRLTVADVDLTNARLSVKTKTETRATVRIIPQLAEEIQKMQLQNFSKNDFVLTASGIPGKWPAKENTRTKEFSDRFTKVKDHFGFGSEYGIYSIRHSFALDLYNSFITEGLTSVEAEFKLLTITRHKSVSGLRNYLRDVGALLPKDYGKNFTLDF
jgi:integrase